MRISHTPRAFILTLVLFLLAACGSEEKTTGPLVQVYKSPTCQCCSVWVEHLEEAGFEVEVTNEANVMPTKQRLGVPAGLGSCHTAVVDGYVIEGHVPASDIKRLLTERPKATGLAVPGMPIGSPGMEMGDRRDPYHVYLFSKQADPAIFASHHQPER